MAAGSVISVRAGQRGPIRRHHLEHTTILNINFLLLAAALVIRFVRSGSAAMLKMMGGSPDGQQHTRDHSGVLPHRDAEPVYQSTGHR
jgi:hypothetical protein